MRKLSMVSLLVFFSLSALQLFAEDKEAKVYKMDSEGLNIMRALLGVPTEAGNFKHYTDVVVSAQSKIVDDKTTEYNIEGLILEGGDIVNGNTELNIVETKVPSPFGWGLVSTYKAEVKVKKYR